METYKGNSKDNSSDPEVLLPWKLLVGLVLYTASLVLAVAPLIISFNFLLGDYERSSFQIVVITLLMYIGYKPTLMNLIDRTYGWIRNKV